MSDPVLLDTIAHADLRVAVGYAAAFGDGINQCAVYPTEFDDLQRDYPILFRRDAGGAFYSVVLLGLDRDENLFLDDAGWHARSVPAVRQRGPFMIGTVERVIDGQPRREPMIHVDLAHPRVGVAEGQPVFLPHGGQAPYLAHVVRVLQVIHDGMAQREALFAALTEADVIAPVTLEIALDDTTRYDIPDCHTVDSARLAALDGAALERLSRAGFLRHAFLVASSLGNVSRLIELKNRKRHAAGSVEAVAL